MTIYALPSVSADPGVVALLEDVLERAKRGDVLSVAIAVHTTERGTGGAFFIGGGGDIAHLITGIERLKLRLLQHDG